MNLPVVMFTIIDFRPDKIRTVLDDWILTKYSH